MKDSLKDVLRTNLRHERRGIPVAVQFLVTVAYVGVVFALTWLSRKLGVYGPALGAPLGILLGSWLSVVTFRWYRERHLPRP